MDLLESHLTNVKLVKKSSFNENSASCEDTICENNLRVVYYDQDTEATNKIDISIAWGINGMRSYIELLRSEGFLIEAVKNLTRRINYSELNEALEDEEITEDDFYKSLEEHKNRYVIKARNIDDPEDALIIARIMEKIGYEVREFSTSEVAEMFSVKEPQLLSIMKSLRGYIK